jgi:hypothetical protein
MALTPLGDLARRRQMDMVVDCQVETGGKIIGKVINILKDKYERVSGFEIKAESGIKVIPYEWVAGIDESRKVMIVEMRSQKQA